MREAKSAAVEVCNLAGHCKTYTRTVGLGGEEWFKNAQYVLDRIDPELPLGIYECPTPYKRLLSEDIIKWCVESGRFKTLKNYTKIVRLILKFLFQ